MMKMIKIEQNWQESLGVFSRKITKVDEISKSWKEVFW